MPIDIAKYTRHRPYLYHVTARENIRGIVRSGLLLSATTIVKRAGHTEILTTRRPFHVLHNVGGDPIWLRDQAPLHAGNMRLEEGCTFGEFVRHLNDRVFFWPGTQHGPSAYGCRHFARYALERPVILRFRLAQLLEEQPDVELLFCQYNSGAPRWTAGRASPRGFETFVSAANAAFGVGRVVEVTVPIQVRLPALVQLADTPAGPWRPITAA